MKLGNDLKKPWLIHLKGFLFAVIGLAAAGLLLFYNPNWQTAVLLLLAVWGFCRFYYYLFYVLERYLGREQRFAGVFDALRFLLSRCRGKSSDR
jgi:hypothetical protein